MTPTRPSLITFPLTILMGLIAMTAPANITHAEQTTLWRIGQTDRDNQDLALGPGGWPSYEDHFELDPVYLVGTSNPREHWPYIHPGPSDAWAGSRSHTFMIVFALDKAPQSRCTLTFDLIGTHVGLPPKLAVQVNDASFIFNMPSGKALEAADDPNRGQPHQFKCDIDPGALKAGNNRITITTLSGAWVVYDAIRFDAPSGVTTKPVNMTPSERTVIQWIHPLEALLRGDDNQPRRAIEIGYRHLGQPAQAVVRIGDHPPQTVTLTSNQQRIELGIPPVSKPTRITAEVEVAGQRIATRAFDIKPVRPWKMALMHHTHLDIGYTHTQEDVEHLQWKHLEQAIDIAQAAADNPPATRFNWLPEGTWAMDGYLRQATAAQKGAFFDAIKAGHVELSALYGNALTGLYHPEELLELAGFARRLGREHDITIDAAMISDVPGYTWGIVPVLAKSGVKYLSVGPNHGHRIGHTFAWADQPFYWESPSCKERVLLWVHGKGYSWFHTGLEAALTGEVGATRLTDKRLLGYLDELVDKEYPYDLVPVRYNIGSDNGPPDPHLPQRVKDWNERYVSPQLVISTPSKVFAEFEKAHGDTLPVVRGDFTPYWEDGAASTARETGINRRAADRLVQANALWALLRDTDDYPAASFHDAWRELILYDEHTWGAWNSISDPDNQFVYDQWAWKAQRALNARDDSLALLSGALNTAHTDNQSAIEVLNTCSWQRDGLVTLSPDASEAGDEVRDAAGRIIPSQRLADGSLVFLAPDLPAFSSRRYVIQETTQDVAAAGHARADGTSLRNEYLEAVLDPATGNLISLKAAGSDVNLVDTDAPYAMNEYVYIDGRSPNSPQRVSGPVKVTVIDQGPLVATLRIESQAPGCESLTRELQLVAGQNALRIRDTLDRKPVRTPDGVHIAFPFNVPNGEVRVSGPWSVVRAEKDQLKGACRNWFTVDRWVDVANDDHGVTWVTLDAPLMELGDIHADPIEVGWLKHLEPSQTIFSYVMNNYWETNYKADQPGPTTFEYALRLHDGYDPAAASRFALEQSHPLIVAPARTSAPSRPAPIEVANPDAIVTMLKPADDGRGTIVRLYNPSALAIATEVTIPTGGRQLHHSNLFEDRLDTVTEPITLAPFEFVTLRIEPTETAGAQ